MEEVNFHHFKGGEGDYYSFNRRASSPLNMKLRDRTPYMEFSPPSLSFEDPMSTLADSSATLSFALPPTFSSSSPSSSVSSSSSSSHTSFSFSTLPNPSSPDISSPEISSSVIFRSNQLGEKENPLNQLNALSTKTEKRRSLKIR